MLDQITSKLCLSDIDDEHIDPNPNETLQRRKMHKFTEIVLLNQFKPKQQNVVISTCGKWSFVESQVNLTLKLGKLNNMHTNIMNKCKKDYFHSQIEEGKIHVSLKDSLKLKNHSIDVQKCSDIFNRHKYITFLKNAKKQTDHNIQVIWDWTLANYHRFSSELRNILTELLELLFEFKNASIIQIKMELCKYIIKGIENLEKELQNTHNDTTLDFSNIIMNHNLLHDNDINKEDFNLNHSTIVDPINTMTANTNTTNNTNTNSNHSNTNNNDTTPMSSISSTKSSKVIKSQNSNKLSYFSRSSSTDKYSPSNNHKINLKGVIKKLLLKVRYTVSALGHLYQYYYGITSRWLQSNPDLDKIVENEEKLTFIKKIIKINKYCNKYEAFGIKSTSIIQKIDYLEDIVYLNETQFIDKWNNDINNFWVFKLNRWKVASTLLKCKICEKEFKMNDFEVHFATCKENVENKSKIILINNQLIKIGEKAFDLKKILTTQTVLRKRTTIRKRTMKSEMEDPKDESKSQVISIKSFVDEKQNNMFAGINDEDKSPKRKSSNSNDMITKNNTGFKQSNFISKPNNMELKCHKLYKKKLEPSEIVKQKVIHNINIMRQNNIHLFDNAIDQNEIIKPDNCFENMDNHIDKNVNSNNDKKNQEEEERNIRINVQILDCIFKYSNKLQQHEIAYQDSIETKQEIEDYLFDKEIKIEKQTSEIANEFLNKLKQKITLESSFFKQQKRGRTTQFACQSGNHQGSNIRKTANKTGTLIIKKSTSHCVEKNASTTSILQLIQSEVTDSSNDSTTNFASSNVNNSINVKNPQGLESVPLVFSTYDFGNTNQNQDNLKSSIAPTNTAIAATDNNGSGSIFGPNMLTIPSKFKVQIQEAISHPASGSSDSDDGKSSSSEGSNDGDDEKSPSNQQSKNNTLGIIKKPEKSNNESPLSIIKTHQKLANNDSFGKIIPNGMSKPNQEGFNKFKSRPPISKLNLDMIPGLATSPSKKTPELMNKPNTQSSTQQGSNFTEVNKFSLKALNEKISKLKNSSFNLNEKKGTISPLDNFSSFEKRSNSDMEEKSKSPVTLKPVHRLSIFSGKRDKKSPKIDINNDNKLIVQVEKNVIEAKKNIIPISKDYLENIKGLDITENNTVSKKDKTPIQYKTLGASSSSAQNWFSIKPQKCENKDTEISQAVTTSTGLTFLPINRSKESSIMDSKFSSKFSSPNFFGATNTSINNSKISEVLGNNSNSVSGSGSPFLAQFKPNHNRTKSNFEPNQVFYSPNLNHVGKLHHPRKKSQYDFKGIIKSPIFDETKLFSPMISNANSRMNSRANSREKIQVDMNNINSTPNLMGGNSPKKSSLPDKKLKQILSTSPLQMLSSSPSQPSLLSLSPSQPLLSSSPSQPLLLSVSSSLSPMKIIKTNQEESKKSEKQSNSNSLSALPSQGSKTIQVINQDSMQIPKRYSLMNNNNNNPSKFARAERGKSLNAKFLMMVSENSKPQVMFKFESDHPPNKDSKITDNNNTNTTTNNNNNNISNEEQQSNNFTLSINNTHDDNNSSGHESKGDIENDKSPTIAKYNTINISPYLRGYYSDSEVKSFTKSKRKILDISFVDFEFIKPIGEGGFGTVWLVRKKATGDYYAMKLIDCSNQKDIQNYLVEREVFSVLNGDFVVKAVWTFIYHHYLCFVMEYMIGGDFGSILEKYSCLYEETAKFYIAEIVLALETLHKIGIIHRDLKPENILLDSKGHIKLTDFGLSDCKAAMIQKRNTDSLVTKTQKKVLPHQITKFYAKETKDQPNNVENKVEFFKGDSKLSGKKAPQLFPDSYCRISSKMSTFLEVSKETKDKDMGSFNSNDGENKGKNNEIKKVRIKGTPDYIAPEIIKGLKYDEAIDWWSLGILMYEFICGIPPFNDQTVENIFDNILNLRINWPEIGQYNLIFGMLYPPNQLIVGQGDDCMSPHAYDLITKLLVIDPKQRLKVNEIKNHPFFEGIDWKNIRTQGAPITPKFVNMTDISNFTRSENIKRKDIKQFTDERILLEKKGMCKLDKDDFNLIRFDILHQLNQEQYQLLKAQLDKDKADDFDQDFKQKNQKKNPQQ